MCATDLVQSFLLDVKQTRDTIAAEVIHFTSRKVPAFPPPCLACVGPLGQRFWHSFHEQRFIHY